MFTRLGSWWFGPEASFRCSLQGSWKKIWNSFQKWFSSRWQASTCKLLERKNCFMLLWILECPALCFIHSRCSIKELIGPRELIFHVRTLQLTVLQSEHLWRIWEHMVQFKNSKDDLPNSWGETQINYLGFRE